MRPLSLFAALALLLAVSAAAQSAPGYPHARPTDSPTALDRYIAKPDANYRWELARTEEKDGVTSYTLDLTSQQWRTEAEVDRPIWRHWLTISVPAQVDYDTALLFIDGGSNRGGEARGADGDMERLARDANAVTATLFMVPNQPLKFAGEFWGRSEDALIAYTWDKYFRTGDEEWPARLPMTKAAVRAMDALQEFCASEAGGQHAVSDFVVAGGSKRGWTTWTTAIVDARVKAIVPCVIDLVNVIPSFRHHYSVLGFWSAAIGDYQALHILDWLDTPENESLMRIVDPWYYLDRLQLPKLIMHAGNDQFFLPDSSQFYWKELQGPKWIRCIPNVGHGLDREEALASLASFFIANAADQAIPKYSFTFGEEGSIELRLEPGADGTLPEPTSVKFWQAHNPEARDFRGAKATYEATDLTPVAPGAYRATVQTPEKGWLSYFIEVRFAGPRPETPYTFTSGVRNWPETTPKVYAAPANPPKGFLTAR